MIKYTIFITSLLAGFVIGCVMTGILYERSIARHDKANIDTLLADLDTMEESEETSPVLRYTDPIALHVHKLMELKRMGIIDQAEMDRRGREWFLAHNNVN